MIFTGINSMFNNVTKMVPHRSSDIQNIYIQPQRKVQEPTDIYLNSLYYANEQAGSEGEEAEGRGLGVEFGVYGKQ